MTLKELLEMVVTPHQTIHLFVHPYEREPVTCEAKDLMEMFKTDILELDIEKIQALRAPMQIVLKRKQDDNKIPHCEKCINYDEAECDSWQCMDCKNGSNFEEDEEA